MKLVTLCLFLNTHNKEVLLGYKKRGFGVGKWDGCGGKVEQNETIEQSAIREAYEEFGLTPTKMYSVGKMHFHYNNPKHQGVMENHVFIVIDWVGELTESEEMMPKWFSIDNMPYHQMWNDFQIWFEQLKQNDFKLNMDYEFYFNENDIIINYKDNSTLFNNQLINNK